MSQLSFAPDRRSLQTTYYHFNDRSSGEFDKRGFTQLDTLIIALDKIYTTKFPNMNKDQVKNLVNILVTEVPISHHNLTFLAAANQIVQYMRYVDLTNELTPALFEKYFNSLGPYIISEVVQTSETKKTPEDLQLERANFKATLLRYILYVQNHIVYRPIMSPVQV